MDWWLILILMLIVLVVLFLSSLPVAFAFLLFNFLGIYYLMGAAGFNQLILSIFDSLTRFSLAPVPLFILMGGVLFHSGVAARVIDIVDKWLGRLPGRLSLLATAAGTIFANLTGSTMANTAMMGTLLVPEMKRRGYSKPLMYGPIMAAGGLAMIIPPSALTVILGSLSGISIGKLLIGGFLPGFLMAALYCAYIIIRAWSRPYEAPSYEVAPTPLSEKLMGVVKYMFPLAFIILAVLGTLFLGVATPTEAAALGAVACFVLAAAYGKLSVKVVKDSASSCIETTVMAFMIIAGATAFSQIMAFTGVSRSLVQVVTNANVAPIIILIGMQIMLLFLGCFMEQVSMMMITLPIFMPVVGALHFDPVWFGIMMLINLEIGMLTPPFGMILFVMKGVAPSDTTMTDIYKAAFPYVLLNILTIALIMVLPPIATYLPDIMRKG